MTDLAANPTINADDPTPRAGPGTYPIPANRGRWRVTLHSRQFTQQQWSNNILCELTSARGRRLDQVMNQAAQFTFTLDGNDPGAALVTELATDVIAWRWDDTRGADVGMFRGVVGQSEDQITDDSAVVTFTCHDYYAMLGRRYVTSVLNYTQQDQDYLVGDIIQRASLISASQGTSFGVGSYLPLDWTTVNPDGSGRPASGQLRDRTYPGNTQFQQIIDDLSAVINGFDFDVLPAAAINGFQDRLRIWYPNRGVARTDMVLHYGSTISGLTRTVTSQDYANYVRVLGNNGSSDPAAAQAYAEAWNSDANNITVNPVGLWMSTDNAADVTIQSTLNDQANGDLVLAGLIVPSYTLTMRPGAYILGSPNIGDTVPLIIKKGRLNVNTTIEILGISYDISDDADETVDLTVGRPKAKFLDTVSQNSRDIDALARR